MFEALSVGFTVILVTVMIGPSFCSTMPWAFSAWAGIIGIEFNTLCGVISSLMPEHQYLSGAMFGASFSVSLQLFVVSLIVECRRAKIERLRRERHARNDYELVKMFMDSPGTEQLAGRIAISILKERSSRS